MAGYDEIIKKLASGEIGKPSASQQIAEAANGGSYGAAKAYSYTRDQIHNQALKGGAYGAIDTRTPEQRAAASKAYHQDRMAKQEEADAKVRGSFWDMIGNAAAMQNSQYLPADQRLELARRQMQAANDFTTGLKESKEASKAIEWDGRQQMVDEYKHLSYEANRARTFHDPKATELAQQATDLQKEIQRRDVMAGNGERDLHAADRMTSGVGVFAKGIGSGLTEFAADAGQAIVKASVNQQLLNENQFLLDQMLGEDTMARYNQVNAAMNSEEGQRVWNQMYSVADSLGEGAARDLNRAKNGLGAIGRAGVDIGVNILQMGFDTGVAALTGGSALVPMFVRVAGESMREARLEGASLERRLAYGVTKATIEVATEKMFDGVAKLYGKGAMDDIVEVAIRRAASTDAGKSMLRILAGASGEAIEEVVSGLLDPLAEAVKTGKIGKLDAEEIAYSAFIGFTIGFLGSGTAMVNGENTQKNAELNARTAMYEQTGNQPTFRQEVRDLGILNNLQSDPAYYQNLNTNNADAAMEVLTEAGRASELQQAQFAAANSQVQAIEERYGVKHDDGGRFVTRNGQKIYSPTTVQELQVYLLLTQTDMTRAEAETIAESKAYSDAFARLTGIEMTSDYSQKLVAIQNAFQKAAESQEAPGGTETSPSAEEATTQDSDELNSSSNAGRQAAASESTAEGSDSYVGRHEQRGAEQGRMETKPAEESAPQPTEERRVETKPVEERRAQPAEQSELVDEPAKEELVQTLQSSGTNVVDILADTASGGKRAGRGSEKYIRRVERDYKKAQRKYGKKYLPDLPRSKWVAMEHLADNARRGVTPDEDIGWAAWFQDDEQLMQLRQAEREEKYAKLYGKDAGQDDFDDWMANFGRDFRLGAAQRGETVGRTSTANNTESQQRKAEPEKPKQEAKFENPLVNAATKAESNSEPKPKPKVKQNQKAENPPAERESKAETRTKPSAKQSNDSSSNIGPKRGRDIARQAYAEDTIAQEEERQTSNAEANVENNTFNEDFEAEDMQLQQDAAETARRAEEAEAKRAADANRPGPIGPKRAAQMDRETNAEADQARAEAREAEAEAANIEGDFDEDAAAEQYTAEQQAAAEAAAEAERKATYEERRLNGQLTEREKAEAKAAAEAKRSEQTNNRLTSLSKWAKSWAERWQSHHELNYNPGAKRILHDELAKAIEGFANGTTTAAELSEIYDSLNAEDATADSKYFYEPDVAQNLKNLVTAEKELTLAQESGAKNVKQKVDALYHQAEQAISNLQTKLDRLDKMADVRTRLFGEVSMEQRVKGEGVRQMMMRGVELYLKLQTRMDTMFQAFGGFNEQGSEAWYNFAKRTADAEKRLTTIGYNARSFFYLLQSQSSEMAKAWADLENGKTMGNVDVPYVGRLSLNYELSLLRTLETEGGIGHIAGNGFEMANEADYKAGRNNNGWGDKRADHKIVTRDNIRELAEGFLEAEDEDHPTAEEWEAAKRSALESLRDELKADVMSSEVGKAAYEASVEMFKYLAREVNKTSVDLFGYEKALNKDYYPLFGASTNATIKAMNERPYDMNSPDFLTPRNKNSKQALKIAPFAETTLSYIQEAANWTAFAGIWSDLQMLDKTMDQPDNNPTIAGMVNDAFGRYAKKYLADWEKVVSNNRPETSPANKMLGNIRKNIAQASLTLNPGVALKQSPSYYAAASILDMDVLVKSRLANMGFFRTAGSYNGNPLIREVDSRSGIISNRKAGWNIIELGESMDAARSFGQKVNKHLPNWMTNWITGRDVSTISNLALACGEQVNKWIAEGRVGYTDMQVGSDAYYDEVTRLLEEVVVKTQPVYDPQFRAELLRSDNEILRSAAMFKTQQTQDFNNLFTVIGEYQAAKSMVGHGGTQEALDAAGKRLSRTIAGQLVAKAAFSALSIISDLLLHRTKKYKDDEGSWSAWKFLWRFAFGTISSAASVLWFGDTVAAIISDTITGTSPLDDTSEFYSISEATVDLINNGIKASIAFLQTVGDPKKTGWQKAKAGKEAAAKIASMYGIPLQNAYNFLNTIVMYEMDTDLSKNFDHNDDFMRSMSNYSQLSDTAIARKTMDRAAISLSKGKLSEAESLLATLNFESNDIISAVASSAKESYINGTLTEKQYRTILKDYCKKKTDDVNKALEDAGRDIAYNEAKEKNEKGFKAAEALIKAATDKRRDDDRPRDYYVMDSILTSTLTDKEKDVTVAANLSKEYRTNYNILRNAGMSSAKTAELLEAIDKNSTGSIDQDELYEWYLGHKADEKKIAALFNAKGYEKGTLTWTKFIDNKKNMPYDELKLANENNKKFNQLDEYAKQLQSDSRIIMQKTDVDQAIYSKIAEMGLEDEEFDAAVQQYVSSDGKKAYNAARNEGYTPDKTVALIKAIDSYYQPKSPDSQNNGSLSIAEIMAYLKEHPDEETVLKSIYYASTTSNKSWEEQKKKAKIK